MERAGRADSLMPAAALFASLALLLRSSERGDVAHSFALLDLDKLSDTNASHGRAVGDLVIARVSDILETSLLPGEQTARWAGDQFVLLLPTVRSVRAQERVRAILATIAAAPIHMDGTVAHSACAGGATFPDHGRTNELLVRAAACALRSAKRRGRGQLMWS